MNLIFIILLQSFVYSTLASKTLIIFLGCAIPEILEDRLATTISYANLIQNTSITFFVSGGNKNSNTFDVSEASKMYTILSSFQHYGNDWNFEQDVYSINTAENLIRARHYLSDKVFDVIYIATSHFHYSRVKLFTEYIFPTDINFSWILAPYETRDLVYWETVHIRNVNKDVSIALRKFAS